MINSASNSSFNIISNNEKLDDKKKKVLDKIKWELLETLNIDEKLVNRNTLASNISKNRYDNGFQHINKGIPQWEIEIRKGKTIKVDETRYSNILNQYEELIDNQPEGYEESLRKLDAQFSEMLILDNRSKLAIEFKDGDSFEDNKNAKTEAEIAFNELNKIKRYHNKIELVQHKDTLFIIKWTDKQEKEIKKKSENAYNQEVNPATVSTDDPEPNPDPNNVVSTDDPEPDPDPDNIVSTDDPEPDPDPDNIVSTDDPEPDPIHLEQKERVATISNVTQVNRAIIQREVDENLRNRYENLHRFSPDRINLFLRRKFIKDREVEKRLRWANQFDWSISWQSAADRHQIEEANSLAERMTVAISSIDSDNYPETRRRLDNLLNRLIWTPTTTPPRQRWISDTNFQTEFQNILDMSGKIFDRSRPSTATSTNWRPISDIIRTNNIKQLSTNILMQANKFRAHQSMVWNIVDHISHNLAETEASFNTFCQGEIQNYINTYNDIPDFMQQLWLSIDKTADYTREIRRLQASDWALTDIAAQSLKLKIQMLDDWWEAYNVKRWKWPLVAIWRFLDDPTGWNDTKFGRWMNEHQNLKEAFWWIRWWTKLATMAVPAMLLWPVWPLAVAGVTWGSSFLMTLFKKKSHYEKELRSYQRMQATNLDTYRSNRDVIANEVAWMKRYEWRFWWKKARDRRQMRDYIKTTQDQLSLSTNLISQIENRLHNTGWLSAAEQLNLAADLADWLARLDYHKKTGQNFLWSNNPTVAEEEYRSLQNAVMWGITRLWITANDLRSTTPYDAYYNNTIRLIENWTWDDYNNQWYVMARKKFKRRSNSKARHWALKAGWASFALSYLLSSLIKKKTTTTEDVENTVHHWKEWGEYNPWDVQENLFVSWDVNPTMRNVINDQTSEITHCDLYSSVDSLKCSYAKWHSELLAAEDNLSSALSNPIVSWNPDISAAFSHYKATVDSWISEIGWLDAWNMELIRARAYESFTEWVLDPIIHSGNSAIKINPDAISRVNWWAQSSWTWVIWQSFRNMWIVDIDFIQRWTQEVTKSVTRAIPIPVGLNTFGSYQSRPQSQQP